MSVAPFLSPGKPVPVKKSGPGCCTGSVRAATSRLCRSIAPRSPPTLAESQLFGHEKGAFTGAAGRSLGVFRAAAGGIVFLDEVGEMPLELQPKLLRVLQQNEVTPVGSSIPLQIDIQIIAATNRELEVEVTEGRFREDLFYRLNMVELRVPPLRHRVEDIPHFVEFFAQKFAAKYQRPRWKPTPETLRAVLRVPLAGQHSPVGARHRAGLRARLRAAAAGTAAATHRRRGAAVHGFGPVAARGGASGAAGHPRPQGPGGAAAWACTPTR